MEEAPPTEVVRDLAERARGRVHFEEDVLALSDDAYRVARRLTGSQQEAEDLVQEAYVRAFRSWQQFRPGTNLRAWLLRIVHNLAVDASRKRSRTPHTEPVEEGDYYLYHRLGAGTAPEESDQVLERLSQGASSPPSRRCRSSTATPWCSSISRTSHIRTRPTSSTCRSAPSCRASTADAEC